MQQSKQNKQSLGQKEELQKESIPAKQIQEQQKQEEKDWKLNLPRVTYSDQKQQNDRATLTGSFLEQPETNSSFAIQNDPMRRLAIVEPEYYHKSVATVLHKYDTEQGKEAGTELLHNSLAYYASKGDMFSVRYIMESLGLDYRYVYDHGHRSQNYEKIADDYLTAAAILRSPTSVVPNNKCGPSHDVIARHYKGGGASKATVASHTTPIGGHLTALAQYKEGEYIHQNWDNTTIVKAPSIVEAEKLICGLSPNLSSNGLATFYGLADNSYYQEFVLPDPQKIDKNNKERVLELSQIEKINELKLSPNELKNLKQLSTDPNSKEITKGEVSCKTVLYKNSIDTSHGIIESAEVSTYSKNGKKIKLSFDGSQLNNQLFSKGKLDVLSTDGKAFSLEAGNSKITERAKNAMFNQGYKSVTTSHNFSSTIKINNISVSTKYENVHGQIKASTKTTEDEIKQSGNDYRAHNAAILCAVDVIKQKPLTLQTGAITSTELIYSKRTTPPAENEENQNESHIAYDQRIKSGAFVHAQKEFLQGAATINGKAALLKVYDASEDNPSTQKDGLFKMQGEQIELGTDLSVHGKNGLGGSVGLTYANLNVHKSVKKEIKEVHASIYKQNVANINGLDTNARISLGKETKDLKLVGCKEQLEHIHSGEISATLGYTLPTNSKAWRLETSLSHRQERDKITDLKDKETKAELSVSYKF